MPANAETWASNGAEGQRYYAVAESAADAEELSKLLPLERTADFAPQLQQHVQFEQSLR